MDVEVWCRLVKQCLWRMLYAVFTTMQQVVWLITGTHRKLVDGRLLSNYHRSAQVLKVVARFKFDTFYYVCHLSDFLTTHHCFDTPERVLQDHISLYLVTEDEAIFVEALPDCEVWRSRYGSFMSTAQFCHAVRIVRMPISSLHRLADQLGDPHNLTMIGNTSRCGSTLLTKMFEEIEQVVTLLEPPALTILATLGEVKEERAVSARKTISSIVRLLCKPTTWSESGHVIKLNMRRTAELPVLTSLFPQAHVLFMYRDGLKVAQSRYRVGQVVMFYRLHHAIIGDSALMHWLVTTLTGLRLTETYTTRRTCKHPLTIWSLLWLSMQRHYLEFRESGMPILGVLYEDIVADPETNMRRILRHCDLPEDSAVDCLGAVRGDSQPDTPFSRTVLSRHVAPEYEGEAKAELDAVCRSYDMPPFSAGPYIAPGTITSSSYIGKGMNGVRR